MADEEKKSTDAASSESTANTAKEVKAKPAAKAEKAPPPPDPRVLEAIDFGNRVKASIEAKVGANTVKEVTASKDIPILLVDNGRWRDTVAFLKSDTAHAYDLLEFFGGVDYKTYLEVVIYLYSTRNRKQLSLKVRTPRDNPLVPSLVPVYAGANWEEREAYDLLGIRFEGHPDLRRIFLDDTWKGHPLRKDYSEFEDSPGRGGEAKA